MTRAIVRLASGPAAITTIGAIAEQNVRRATFCNHFISAGEAAYAISIGFKEFQLLAYGDRHLGADPAEVARSWRTSPNIGISDSTGPLNQGPRRD